ncbi:MAG: hypothetical protein KDD94_02735 [Calditrichaeota bacterium]|nr:hypothetical protein [Calditrichota bacterium]
MRQQGPAGVFYKNEYMLVIIFFSLIFNSFNQENMFNTYHISTDDYVFFSIDYKAKKPLSEDGYPNDVLIKRIRNKKELYSIKIQNYDSWSNYNKDQIIVKANDMVKIFDIESGKLIKEFNKESHHFSNGLAYAILNEKVDFLIANQNLRDKYEKILKTQKNLLEAYFTDNFVITRNYDGIKIFDEKCKLLKEILTPQEIKFWHQSGDSFSFFVDGKLIYSEDHKILEHDLSSYGDPFYTSYSSGYIVINSIVNLQIINLKSETVQETEPENQVYGFELYKKVIYYTDDYEGLYTLKSVNIE